MPRALIVVPRKGDVDRNDHALRDRIDRALVVPRKGDVDRNQQQAYLQGTLSCRPPQGGRG